MKKLLSLLAVGSALLFASARPAQAISIGFVPGDLDVTSGDVVAVDIVVSDLGGEVVSAYDLDVTYDPTVVSATGVVFTGQLGGPADALEASDVSTAGLVDLASLSFLSDADLLTLQGGSTVTLASISFSAIATGTSALGFVWDQFNDVKGLNAEPLTFGRAPIPEPSSAVIFLVGAAIVGGAVRRRLA